MRRRTASLNLLSLEDRSTPAVMNFTLTTPTSILALGGSLDGNAIAPQSTAGVGSLSTTYTGTVRVDVDFSSGTIQFLTAGSSMAANNNGTWQPTVGGGVLFIPGSAAGNYGANITVSGLPTKVAGRGLIGAFSSPTPLPLSGVNFDSSQTFTLTAGSVDYYNVALRGNEPLAKNNGPNNGSAGSFTDTGNGNYALVMPCSALISDLVNGLVLDLTINGTLNATAVLPVVDLNGASSGADSTFVHTAGAAGSKIAPAATITRTPSANLMGMTVTLAGAPDGAAESLAVSLTGTGLSGNYDSLTSQLVITGNATLGTYQTVLRNITYSNSNTAGTPGPRPVTVTVTDGTNASLVHTADGTVSLPIIPAKITGVQVNDGEEQRSRVTKLRVTFDTLVTLLGNPVDAFGLMRSTDGEPVDLAAVVDNTGPSTFVTLSFTGGAIDADSLKDGRYTLTVLATQVNNGGLDGDGNGTVGDNYTLVGNAANKFHRLFGDADGNGTVEGAVDFPAFGAEFGVTAPNLAFDFDGNGQVEGSVDFPAFGGRFGSSL